MSVVKKIKCWNKTYEDLKCWSYSTCAM